MSSQQSDSAMTRLRERVALWLLPPATTGSRPFPIVGHVPGEDPWQRRYESMVFDANEVYGIVFSMLHREEPDVAGALNELQEAARRMDATAKTGTQQQHDKGNPS